MTFYEFCDRIDETLHDYGKYLIPVFIFVAAVALLVLGYLATHEFPGLDAQGVSQELNK
ncbi:MAG: hypothetical protein Q7S75_03835 [bacterium]|nr:hypothetical protein [bacterium]